MAQALLLFELCVTQSFPTWQREGQTERWTRANLYAPQSGDSIKMLKVK